MTINLLETEAEVASKIAEQNRHAQLPKHSNFETALPAGKLACPASAVADKWAISGKGFAHSVPVLPKLGIFKARVTQVTPEHFYF